MRRAFVASVASVAASLFIASAPFVLDACRAQDGGAPSGNCAASDAAVATPIDTDVMAFLSAARARHHEANVKEDSGDVPGAVDALNALVAMKTPHPGTLVVEVEEVLADAYARLAELHLKAKDLDSAARDATQGLAHASDPTYFRGHLLELQGIVEEERAKRLDADGKREEAQLARARAIQLFHEVVGIQSRVIERSLGDGGGK